MSDGERRDRRAIEIPEDVAEAAAIPEDLNANVVGPYSVPDTARRRRAAIVYFVGAAGVGALVVAGLPTLMWWTAVLPLGLIGIYHVIAGWHLEVREERALEAANREVHFPVGHASAALGFTGWRARPVWNVLVFSADDPPSERALVRIDAINASAIESYSEEVPPVAST
jgi:hypothetical protein